MKIMLAAAALFLASAAKAELPCKLSDQDFVSLALSTSKARPDSVQSLDPAKQQMLCQTRKFLHAVIDANGFIEDPVDYSPTYLSPAEKTRVGRAVDDAITRRIMRAAGVTISA